MITDQNLLNRSRKSSNVPDEAIRGDYDGDGTFEYMWVQSPKLSQVDMDCVGECTSYIRFNDKFISPIPIENAIERRCNDHMPLVPKITGLR